MVTEIAPTIRELLLEAIKEGNHTVKEFKSLPGLNSFNTDQILFELEVLEGIEIFKVNPPEAPFISWWLKVPKGKIIYNESGKLIEQSVEKAKKIEIPIKISIPQKTPEITLLGDVVDVPVELIDPNKNNPRGLVNTQDQNFLDLVESIKEIGILEPLIIVRNGKRFRNVIGHRRHKAAISAGLETVPCIIREFEADEEEDVMLIENIQRQNLTLMQQARAFSKRYIKLGKNINAVARNLGLTQSYIAQRLRLLKSIPEVQQLIDERKLGLTHGILLSGFDEEKQKKLLPRATQVKIEQFKLICEAEKQPSQKKKRGNLWKRVTTNKERFTRSGALKTLEKLGDVSYPAKYLINAFDDVCLDACVEQKNEELCHGCPIPRFIVAITRHQQKEDSNGKS